MLSDGNVVIQHKRPFFSPLSVSSSAPIHYIKWANLFYPCLFIYSFDAYLWAGPGYSILNKTERDPSFTMFVFELGRRAINRHRWVYTYLWIQREEEAVGLRLVATEITGVRQGLSRGWKRAKGESICLVLIPTWWAKELELGLNSSSTHRVCFLPAAHCLSLYPHAMSLTVLSCVLCDSSPNYNVQISPHIHRYQLDVLQDNTFLNLFTHTG